MVLRAVFYARFHPERGPSVIHQFPNGSIIARPSEVDQVRPLVSFSDISAYIIPPYELCDRPFSICSDGYRVLGFPISLEDAKYERNRFTFNVCFLLNEVEDAQPWRQVVAKTASFFRAMETDDGLLQAEEGLAGLKWADDADYPAEDVGVIYTLLEVIFTDMNTYEETCIRIDEFHVLNLRLIQPRPPPPKVRAWDVPLLVRSLPSSEQWTWDLVLQHVHPHLDGVKHVQRIAELAYVELKLVKRAVRGLIYHQWAIVLDLFHFQAIYTPTADLTWFVNDEEMLGECCRYVATEPMRDETIDTQAHRDPSNATVTGAAVINLYASLSPGVPLHDFVLAHEDKLTGIDIRRFITFGIIKGFLRRIHKYALATNSPSSQLLSTQDSSPTKNKPRSNEDAVRDFDRAWKRAALTSGWATPPTEPPPIASLARSQRSAEEFDDEEGEKLRRYLDGTHCLDEICVAMRLSEKKVIEKLRSGSFGEVMIFNK